MHAVRMNLLEAVLRLCAESAPRPWYPRAYAAYSGVDRDALEDALEEVWLERLVDRVAGSKEEGAGLVLSALGERVLRDPEALARLREGRPVVEGDPGAVVRHSLRRPARPVVSRLLLAANLLVFGYGLYLAVKGARARPGLVDVFLTGGLAGPKNPAVAQRLSEGLQEILHRSGGVWAPDLLRGEWWRMLTTAFVHGGLLHLGLNLFILYRIGAVVEQTWGRWRFLVIYFLAAWGGSCVALAYQPVQVVGGVEWPVQLVGASGALCGIFGAEAAWVLLYGKYLPRSLARRGRRLLVVNLLLLVFISLLPRVSGWAHLGGALTGAAAALVLHVQRFGPKGLRWLAVAALVPLAWAPWAVLGRQQGSNPRWAKLIADAETRDFRKRFIDPTSTTSIGRVKEDALRVYQDEFQELWERHPTRRDAAKVEKALRALEEQRSRLSEVAEALRTAGPYRTERVEEARQAALEYVQAFADVVGEAQRCLKAGPKWTGKDDDRLEQMEETVSKLHGRWRELAPR
jgi:membrane associated rhomboid family serine protease